MWKGVERCGRVWKGVQGCGRVCKGVEGCARVWKSVEECGRVVGSAGYMYHVLQDVLSSSENETMCLLCIPHDYWLNCRRRRTGHVHTSPRG